MEVDLSLRNPNILKSVTFNPMRRRDDVTVVRLISAYEAHGGLATSHEIVLLMRPFWRQPISVLARWIVNHRVVSLSWNAQILLPLFQFVQPRMAPHEAVSDSAFELGECMEDQAVAGWFLKPNPSLHDKAPIELFTSDPESVVQAAHETCVAMTGMRLAGDRLTLARV